MSHPVKKRGIFADPQNILPEDLKDKVADFAYENDSLADLIVECWTNDNTLANLTTGSDAHRKHEAQKELGARGIYLDFPIVVTEDEYEGGFHLAAHGLPTNNGVVFVVPRKERVTTNTPKPLLETAKMLMAIVPNGI